MAEQLTIDFVQLGDTVAQLHGTKTALADTAEMSAGLAALTGHELLGGAIIYFAERWNIKRGDMIDAVEVLRAAADKIITDVKSADDGLASQFDSAAAGTATAAPAGAQ